MRRLWVLAAAFTCACSGSSAAPDARPSHPSPASYDAAQPVGVVVAAGKVWTVEAGGNDVVGRSGPNAQPVKVAVGATPLRATYDGHLLWVSVFGTGRVVAVDPSTNEVVRRVRMPGQPEGVVSAFGAVWVVRQQAGLLTRVTPTGKRGPSYHLGDEPRLVTANDTALFASNFTDGTITRVDPHTGQTATSDELCTGAQGMAATADVVWVACTPDDSVVAVDARSLEPLGSVAVDGEPDAILFDGSHLHVVTTSGPTVVELSTDPAHPEVVSRTPLGQAAPLFDQANVDAAVVDGTWWVSSPSENTVYVYTP